MAITFTWSVKDMHKVTATGAIYKVEWSCSGVDADTSTSHSRSGTLTDPPDPSTYTYASLNEATVIGWVKDNGVRAYNEGLITSNINSIIAAANLNSTGTPWAAE
jgi:hypothetical protein